VRQRKARHISETPKICSKKIWELCRRHPVDCPNCVNEPGCQMKDDMRAHPDKIKRCRFFRPREG